jgi:hypothetical protein
MPYTKSAIQVAEGYVANCSGSASWILRKIDDNLILNMEGSIGSVHSAESDKLPEIIRQDFVRALRKEGTWKLQIIFRHGSIENRTCR